MLRDDPAWTTLTTQRRSGKPAGTGPAPADPAVDAGKLAALQSPAEDPCAKLPPGAKISGRLD
ncbi:MAG: hypothetical protein U0787_13560 [Polyangia bacterium]